MPSSRLYTTFLKIVREGGTHTGKASAVNMYETEWSV